MHTSSTLCYVQYYVLVLSYSNAVLVSQRIYYYVLDVFAGVVKRCFWGLITAICVIVLVFHLTVSSIQFFSYQTDVSVALVTRRQLTFPAVTICNLNPVKQSAVSGSSALSRLINDDKRRRKKRAAPFGMDIRASYHGVYVSE